MRIAIVDDMLSERTLLGERLQLLLSRQMLDGALFEYENGEDFLSSAKKKPFEQALPKQDEYAMI